MSIADAIKKAAATWPNGSLHWNVSVEREIVQSFLTPYDERGSVMDSRTFMLLVAEAIDGEAADAKGLKR